MKEGRIDNTDPLFITLGSNINSLENVNSAISLIREEFENIKVSNYYKTPAVLGPLNEDKQEDYLNAAVLTMSELDPEFIKFKILRKIERRIGRIRSEDKFEARLIDLDIAIYGSKVVHIANIAIPDPDILQHAHVIFPLCDLDPDFIHPITDEKLSEIKNNFDKRSIKLYED